MANRLLVDNLIAEVRSLIGETDTDGALDDDTDILPALNSAFNLAIGILARHYAPPLMTSITQTITSGTASYTMPEDAVEDRIRSCETIIQTGSYEEIRCIDASQAMDYDQPGTVPCPATWHVEGRNLVFTPTPNGAYNIRIKYPKQPPMLAKKLGKITTVNTTGAGYVRVDSLSDSASTSVDSESSYVCIVDGQTGLIKGAMQITAITQGTTDLVTFTASPARTSIDGQAISTSIASMGVAVGDYLAPAPYTCICTLREPVSSFIVRHAGTALNEPLGGDNAVLLKSTSEFEKLIQSQWVGQPTPVRVKRSSSSWGYGNKVYRPNQTGR